MKNSMRTLLAAAALACTPVLAGSFLVSERAISDATIPGQFPVVAYFNNVIHAAWVAYPNGANGSEIYYAVSTNGGSTWSAPVNLSNTNGVSEDRPQITAGPNGVVVAWNTDNNTGAVLAARNPANNGTGSFGGPVTIGDSGGTFYSRLSGIFTDSGGDVHIVYYDNGYNPGGANVGQIRHRMMCGAGATLGTDTGVTSYAVDGDVDNENPRIGEAGGKMYVVFRSSRNGNPQGGWPPQSVQMQSGTKSGCAVNWTYPARRIAGGVPLSFATVFTPTVFGDSGGNLHLGWWDGKAGVNTWYRKGNPASGTLGPATQVSAFGLDHLEPGGVASDANTLYGGFAVSPGLVSNGTAAFMSYQRNQFTVGAGFEHGQVYLRESLNNGTTWGTELAISGTGQATTPEIAMGGPSNNNVAIVWADVRQQPARIFFRLYTLNAVAGPAISVSPGTFAYADTQVSAQSATQAFTVQNTGTSSATFSGIAVTGDYAITANTCGATLANGASCTVTVRFTPTALGARNGTLTVNSNAFNAPAQSTLSGTGIVNANANPTTRFNNNVSAVVTGYYETILNRSPDSGGLGFWSGEATRVAAIADVKEVFFAMSVQFFSSPEYVNRGTSDVQYITDLYHTFFIREPDQAGLDFWVQQLNPGGMDRGAMLNNFLFSPEFSNFMASVFGNTSAARPEANITMDLYRGILGVLPDNGGFNFWFTQLKQANCQGGSALAAKIAEIGGAFVNSPEYANREAARAAPERTKRHVGDLFNAFLRRGGDLGGYNFWTNQIAGGFQSRDQVRAQFIASPEFQGRVQAVVQAGCAP